MKKKKQLKWALHTLPGFNRLHKFQSPMAWLSYTFLKERVNGIADMLGFNSFDVVVKLQWPGSHVHHVQVPYRPICQGTQCSFLLAILLFIGIICIQKKLSEILTASPTFSLASITTWSYIVKIEESACLLFLLSSTSFTIEKRYNFSSLFRSSTMWSHRVGWSTWPLFVGREFLRIRPMIEQITSTPLQKCVSTWRGGSEKREEQSSKSPLDLGSTQDALEGANSSRCSFFLSCSFFDHFALGMSATSDP